MKYVEGPSHVWVAETYEEGKNKTMSKKKKGKYPKGLNPINPGYLLDPKSSSPRGRDQLLGLLGRTRVAEVIGSYSVVVSGKHDSDASSKFQQFNPNPN